MVMRTVIHCNGFVGGRGCRNTVSLGHTTSAKAMAHAEKEGWSQEHGLHYCASCTRRRLVIAQNLDRDRR